MPSWLSDLVISFPYYDTDLAPFYSRFWATFAHFDGIHYLRLASHGYADWGSQAFFPLYPLLIHLLSPFTPSPLAAGLLISWLSLLIAGLGLRRLFPRRPRLFWLVLAFPTAFFFLTAYTESLFFALTIWFFVFLSRQKWWLAALLAGLASATRLVGAFLAISLFIELLHQPPRPSEARTSEGGLSIVHRSLLILLSLSGLLAYMFFLYQTTGDPLLFFHVQPVFGGGRSGGELILLPQVLYRYAKMILTTNWQTFLFWRVLLELSTFTWAVSVLIDKFKKFPLAVSTYLSLSLLLPTLTGTLSSLPRYILVLAPWLIPQTRQGIWLYLAISLPLALLLLFEYSRGIFIS